MVTEGNFFLEDTATDYNVTTVAPTLDPETQARVDYYTSVSRYMTLYVTPFILFGGTVGNVITIAVVVSRHFRSSPSSVLLLTLAIVDIGVLYFNLLDIWLGALTGGASLQFTRDQGPTSCKISVFLTYFLTHSSSWILVLINIDRVISVYQPLKARTWCTKRRLVMAFSLIFVLLALISLHVFWTVNFFDEYETYKCQIDDKFMGDTWYKFWLILDGCLFTFAPFIIILTCNLAIIIALLKARRKRSNMSARTPGGSNDGTTSITSMLVTISIVFLVSTSPLTICYQFIDPIFESYKNDPVGQALYVDLIINTFLVLLCYSNNAVNFLLYCISGSKFRRALLDLCGGKKRQRAQAEQCTTHTSMATRTSHVNANKIQLTDLSKVPSAKTNGQTSKEFPHQYVNHDYVP